MVEDPHPNRGEGVSPEVMPRPNFDNLDRAAEPEAMAEGGAEGGRPLLDKRTQLVIPRGRRFQDSGWKFTFWPGCGEASLCIVTSGSSRSSNIDRHREKSDDEGALHWQIANGRAGTRSRRYFVTNGLRYMWVLTFKGEHFNRRQVMSDVADFARRLRVLRGGANFPYWYSPELHPGGHGWHVNFFISFRVEHAMVEELWEKGFVWVTDFATAMKGPKGEPLGLCRTPRDGLRRAASYGCKYAQKDWSPEHVGALNHRYEVAQGFAPLRRSGWVEGPLEAESLVQDLVPVTDQRWLKRWNSDENTEWNRPPIRTWRW